MMEKQEILKTLTRNAFAKRYRLDECVFRESDAPVEGLGFVLMGKVRILRLEGRNSVLLGTVTAGQFFGETALVLGRPRGATVVSDDDNTIILFLNREEFLREARQNFSLVRLLTQEALDRLGRVEHLLFRQAQLRPFAVDPSLGPVIQDTRSSNPGIAELVKNTRSIFANAGTPVIRQGERNDGQAFLVTEGEIHLARSHNGATIDLLTLQCGDFLPPLNPQLTSQREYSLVSLHGNARLLAFDDEVLYRIMGLNHRLFLGVFQSVLVHLMIRDDSLDLAVKQGSGGTAPADSKTGESGVH